MLSDVWTMAWKECRELLLAGGSQRQAVVRFLLLPAVWGIYLPAQTGRAWVTQPESLLNYGLLPAFLVVGLVADCFAGERERHTLETLLASRLPDRAILLGKVAAVAGYAWGATLLTLALALAVVNVVHGHGQLLMYAPGMALAAVALSLVEAVLATSAGVLVSLRAATVRQAQQTLTFGFIGLSLLLLAPFLLLRSLPVAWQSRLEQVAAATTPAQAVLGALGAMLALAAGLLAGAMARFRRARLILE